MTDEPTSDSTSSSSKEATETLSFDQVSFPTDSLTVRQLIDIDPTAFAWDPEALRRVEHRRPIIDLLDALYLERELAARICQEQQESQRLQSRTIESTHFGPSDDEKSVDTSELIESLSSCYERLGLSSGVKATAQMVRRFQQEALRRIAPGPAK